MKFTTYILRYKFATLLVRKQWEINLVSEIAWYSSLTTIAVYTYLFKYDKENTSIVIDSAINDILNGQD